MNALIKKNQKTKSQYQLLVGFAQICGVSSKYNKKLKPLFFAYITLTEDAQLIFY